jgi:O-antigen ligase
MDILVLLLPGIILLMMAPVIPVTWRFAAAIILSVPQFYILPLGDFYLSLALIASYLLWPEAIKNLRNLVRRDVLFLALAVIALHGISLLWSTDLRLGLRTLVYALPFVLVAATAYSIGKHNPRIILMTLGVTGVAMSLQAALVVMFRLSPELEMAYLTSNISGTFGGPNTIKALLDGSLRNNVLAPSKAGGMFINGNIAAAYLGLGVFITFLSARVTRSRLLFVVLLGLWVSIFFTGSKSGIMLAVALPFTALAFSHYIKYEKQSRRLVLAAALVVIPLVIAMAAYTMESISERSAFAAASLETASSRLLIWTYAVQAFAESPLLGQGFGGWQEAYPQYALDIGINPVYPPHNTLIYLWSQSGVLAVILGLVFMFHVMRLAYRLAASSQQSDVLLGLTLGMVAGWLFIQGMGENWGLFGDPRQQPIFAALVGLAYATFRRSDACRESGQIVPTGSSIRTNPT